MTNRVSNELPSVESLAEAIDVDALESSSALMGSKYWAKKEERANNQSDAAYVVYQIISHCTPPVLEYFNGCIIIFTETWYLFLGGHMVINTKIRIDYGLLSLNSICHHL